MLPHWQWFYWTDNTHLMINIAYYYNPGNLVLPYVVNPTDFLLFDPFTGARKNLISNYPGLYTYQTQPIWVKYDATVYDPGQKLVIYAALIDDFAGYVLWDLEKQQRVVRISVNVLGSSSPEWSPDGALFVITTFTDESNLQGAQIRNRTGALVYNFDLSKYLPNFSPDQFTWSSDGHYLAFALSRDDNDVSTGLGVLNMQTKAIALYCFPDKDINFEITNIVWSPDDQRLVIGNGNYDTDRVFLLNIADKTAVQIAENSTVRGWMAPTTK
jgi:Tol biopolymer transport system component